MRFRKGRIAMLLLGAAIIWLGGTVVVRRVLLSKYTYAMERVDPITGTSQRIFQPGEEADRATARNAATGLACGLVAVLALTIGMGTRRGHWLNGAASDPQLSTGRG